MRPTVSIEGDLREIMSSHYRTGERAVSAAMRGTSEDVKGRWRRQITGAGLGNRLANTVRSEVYPQSDVSMNAAAVIWSKAPHIVGAFDAGVTIRSADGFWLAIPTEAAGKKAGRSGGRMTPLDWERRHGLPLRFVYRPGRAGLLVADDARVNKRGQARRKGGRRRKSDGILTGAQTVVIFILVPQVTLRKRLDLSRDVMSAVDGLPARIVANWPDD